MLRDGTGVIEFFTTEWHNDNLLVTTLAEYKLRAGRASPALIMRHYRELEQQKHIVLMRGQIDPTRLSVAEAGLIANQFQLQYLSEPMFNLVRIFNETPEKFDVNDLLGIYLGRGRLGSNSLDAALPRQSSISQSISLSPQIPSGGAKKASSGQANSGKKK